MSNKARHLERFMPYACDRGGLVVRRVHVAVDDDSRGELASGSTLQNSSSTWETLKLAVALERSGDLLSLLHPDELGHPPVAVVLSVRCRATFLSHPQRIQHPDPTVDRFEHTITLRRNEICGEVSITPHLIRTADHAPRVSLASRKGAWLMKGDPWILQIDETKPRQGNDLEVLRKRFSEVPGISTADQHNWFALHLESKPEQSDHFHGNTVTKLLRHTINLEVVLEGHGTGPFLLAQPTVSCGCARARIPQGGHGEGCGV